MDGAMIASVVDGKVHVTEMVSGKTFKFLLIPHQDTEAGTQTVFAVDTQLDRIATCITELNGIPTQVLKGNFVQKMIATLEKAKHALKSAVDAVGDLHEEKSDDKKTDNASSLSAKN